MTKIKRLSCIDTVNTGLKLDEATVEAYKLAAEFGYYRAFFNPGNAYTKLIKAHEPNRINLMPSRIIRIDPEDEIMSGNQMCMLKSPLGASNTKFGKPIKWNINVNGSTPYDFDMGGKPGVAVMLLMSIMSDTIAKAIPDEITIDVMIQVDKSDVYQEEIQEKMNGTYIFGYGGSEKVVSLNCLQVRSEGDHITYGDDGKLFGPGNHVSIDLGGNTVIYRQYRGNVKSEPKAFADSGASKLINDLIQRYALLIHTSYSETVAQQFLSNPDRFTNWDYPRLPLEKAEAMFAKMCKEYAYETMNAIYNRHSSFLSKCDTVFFLGGLAGCEPVAEAFLANEIVKGRGKVMKNPQIVDMVKMLMTAYERRMEPIHEAAMLGKKRQAEIESANEIKRKQQEREAASAEMSRVIHSDITA